MKFGLLFILGVTAITTLGFPGKSKSDSLPLPEPQLSNIQSATDRFQSLETASAAGYNFTPTLDYCNPGVGGAGYHYINLGLIDTIVDPLQPEAMIYVPDTNGTLHLGAVEYIVPVTAWNTEHKAEWPQVMDQQFHLNSTLNVYTLRVWVWKDNPSGRFEDWNPSISCLQYAKGA
jgi:hypothetical protein